MPGQPPDTPGVLSINTSNMQYFFSENGKDIEIPLERWVWGIVYQDDSELRQFEALEGENGPTGRFHRVGEIDQERIKMAVLYKPDDMSKRIDIPWRDGMKLIHKYRNIVFDYMSDQKREVRVYMFGYKDGNHHSILYVLPDDRIVFSNNENHDVTQHQI